ncbi:HDOD domain-containing protein [Massilia aerilata]|uniref:HDOD domain-containing protein n=1 Tax=Massilia aerilata TaxID=453817 RepID=A0ABW0RS53_9BURK
MKNWIARLFGGGMAAARAGPIVAQAAAAPATPAGRKDQDLWHCLTAGATASAPTPQALTHAQLVLAELDRLIASPADAEGLVPRVPEVIPQLLRSLRDEDASSADLARLVARDPALVAELIREANSPFYRSSRQVRTIDAALLVLGRNGLRMLLARAAFRPLIGMQGGRHSRQAGPRLWNHTENCALAASLLAPSFRADPFEAYLAGLMDDLGLIVAFRLFDSVLEADALPREPAFVDALLARTRTLAARIAMQWEMPPPIAAAILGAADQAPATALAGTLLEAERLACLRMMMDQGVQDVDYPGADDSADERTRVFERLLGP